MAVKRDPRTGRWFFRTVVRLADGRRERVYGTPGIPGPYHDLAQSKIGAREAEGRAIAAALRGEPIAPAPAEQEVTTPKTIREHAVQFLELYKPDTKASEKREKRKALEGNLLPVFGDRTIESLTQQDIDAYTAAELGRGLAVKTVNNRLAVLSSLIRYVTGAKPNLRLKLSGMPGEINAVPSAHVELLLEHADARERVIVLLAAEAGLRAGEIRGLQRGDVERDRLFVRRALDNKDNVVIAPKHNKWRTIPLSPRLAEAIAALPRRGLWVVSHAGGELVTYDQLNELVNALYTRAEVPRPPKPIHCLRHTFGTVMARRVPLPTLRRLMGHSDIATTMRYVDVAEDDMREAITLVFGGVGRDSGRGSHVAADREKESK